MVNPPLTKLLFMYHTKCLCFCFALMTNWLGIPEPIHFFMSVHCKTFEPKHPYLDCHAIISICFLSGHCPPGWLGGGVSCYKFVLKGYSWQQAQGVCADAGGHLAVVDTLESSALVTGYIKIHQGEGHSLIYHKYKPRYKSSGLHFRD